MSFKPGQLVIIQDTPVRWDRNKQQVYTLTAPLHGTVENVLPTLLIGLFLKYVPKKTVPGKAHPCYKGDKFALVLFGETVECLNTEDFQLYNPMETK